jgi:DNA-directed RNA polymerase subunit N (RpoN/RPB10)
MARGMHTRAGRTFDGTTFFGYELGRVRMLTPIRCKTCGVPIGDVAELFRHMRAKLARAELDKNKAVATKAAIVPDLQIDCSEIFDKLGIPKERYCCRMSLATAMVYSDLY